MRRASGPGGTATRTTNPNQPTRDVDGADQDTTHTEDQPDAEPAEDTDIDQETTDDDSEPETNTEPERESVAAQLVQMVRSEYALGISDDDKPFGVHQDRPHLAMMLRGGKTGMRQNLSRRFFEANRVVPSQQALANACLVLEGYAAEENPQRVHLRIAVADTGDTDTGDTVYIDMGDITGRVIKISGGTWRVVDTAPLLFRRTKITGAMLCPHDVGNLSRFWEFVPVDTKDRPLLLAWLVAALVQLDVPHTVLALIAEQGSAKSSVTRCLVDLVDPSPVPLRKPPRDAEAWVTAATASWVVALDNLSGRLTPWLSDALCRASTGDGDVRRQLYTDDDVAAFSFRRCCIINGVDLAVERGDLAERLLAVDLPRVTERRHEADLAQAWQEARPSVLAGLLDLAAKVHHLLPDIEVVDLPRMADFGKVLAAVDEVLGTNGLDRYRKRSKQAAADTLNGPFIDQLVARRSTFSDSSSAEILDAIKAQMLRALKLSESDWKPPREWPRNARAVTGQLTLHAPALRTQGWTVEHDEGRNKDGVIRWTITPPAERRESAQS